MVCMHDASSVEGGVICWEFSSFPGVVLRALPVQVSSIGEPSMMTRDMCVQLVSVGQGLERTVTADIQFFDFQYAMLSKMISLQLKLERLVCYHASNFCR